MKNLNATFLSFKANSLKSGTINFRHKDEAIQASSAHRIGDNQPISVFGPLFGWSTFLIIDSSYSNIAALKQLA